ncbi:MAG: TIGR02452 family protein [Anaerolineae bacterium]|nr:TIGR02452 family protein [Anaerolineae bacterium]
MTQHISRNRAAEIGQDTVCILEAGHYQTSDGKIVEIRDRLATAVSGTTSYPPDTDPPTVGKGTHSTRIAVNNETTLTAAHRLALAGQRVAALNFASARHPGGGFLGGARAQEESLAHSSGLYACIVHNPMYRYHDALKDPMYSDYVIYSPDVPVFKNDAGALLDVPYRCSFLTSPAVNAKVVLDRNPKLRPAIREAMQHRINKVLAVAAAHQQDTLILGAWGCGVFGNDSAEIAGLFHTALTGDYQGVFDTVVFAVTDWSPEQRFIGPFRKVFQGE